MNLKIGKRIGRRGKIGLAILIAAMFIGVASAAVLTHYNTITVKANVKQSIVVNGKDITKPISRNLNAVGGGTYCFDHWIKNRAPIEATVDFVTSYDPVLDGDEITTTYTTTVTESGSYDDYYDDARIMVFKEVGDMTVSEFLSEDFEYTVNVISNPLYAPNLCFWITDGENTYVVETWGKDWASTGWQTVTIQEFFDGTMGYEVTVDTDYGQANRISDVRPGTYGPWPEGTGIVEFIEDYETWIVLSAQVRAQAGAAGGQVIRPVQFKAAGTTMDVPDSDTFASLTLQPGEMLNFYICYEFALYIHPDSNEPVTPNKMDPYRIITEIKPVML